MGRASFPGELLSTCRSCGCICTSFSSLPIHKLPLPGSITTQTSQWVRVCSLVLSLGEEFSLATQQMVLLWWMEAKVKQPVGAATCSGTEQPSKATTQAGADISTGQPCWHIKCPQDHPDGPESDFTEGSDLALFLKLSWCFFVIFACEWQICLEDVLVSYIMGCVIACLVKSFVPPVRQQTQHFWWKTVRMVWCCHWILKLNKSCFFLNETIKRNVDKCVCFGRLLHLVELDSLGGSVSRVLCNCSKHLELLLQQSLCNGHRPKLGLCCVVAAQNRYHLCSSINIFSGKARFSSLFCLIPARGCPVGWGTCLGQVLGAQPCSRERICCPLSTSH